jgi:rubrerythrin
MSKEKIKELKKKIEALIIAIPRELEAYEFYIELAEWSDYYAS